jgi:chromosome segregation ATPase
MKRKIFALFILAIFLVSTISVFAKEDTERVANSREVVKELKASREDIREVKMNLSEDRQNIRTKITDIKRDCDDDQTNCTKVKENFMKTDAKNYLLNVIEKYENALIHRKEVMQKVLANKTNSTNTAIFEKRIAEIDARLVILAEIKVQAESATTKEETKTIAKQLREQFKNIKNSLDNSKVEILSHRFAFSIEQSESLEKRLDRVLEKLKADGYDVSKIETNVTIFKEHIAKAKALTEEAKTILNAAESSDTESVRNSHELLAEAHKELKLAHQELKSIVAQLKITVKDTEVDNLIENTPETNTTVTTEV